MTKLWDSDNDDLCPWCKRPGYIEGKQCKYCSFIGKRIKYPVKRNRKPVDERKGESDG
jgi:hypothetical protein